VVVIGNFDGVHLGHQAVLTAVERIAAQRKLRPRLLTFEPHPAVTLGREPPARLTTTARKCELVERCCRGISVEPRPFTTDFARQSPEQFVHRVLLEELCTRVVMVGFNFRFGHDRSGGFDDLERFGQRDGFEALAEPVLGDEQAPFSSTRVRELIATGRLEQAREVLGRPHSVSGRVVAGDGRGRTLGFPTCNLSPPPEALPPLGVYAVLVDRTRADGTGGRALGKGAANLGVRPTLDQPDPRPALEVHLFDVDEDLYGQSIRVHLVSRLRGEQRFADLAALREQMEQDCAQAREVLADCEPDDAAGGAWA